MTNPLVDTYQAIVGTSKDLSIALTPFSPHPTNSDYLVGQIVRYFARQANNRMGEIIEVSKEGYGVALAHPFYITISIPWKITGPDTDQFDSQGIRVVTAISKANQLSIQFAEKTIPGLGNKLTNVYQFWLGK